MIRPALLMVLLLSSACAQQLYIKQGATQQEFERDQFDCEQRVITMYGGYTQMGVGHAIMARSDIQRCMVTKGYRAISTAEAEAAHQAEADRIRAENARAAEAHTTTSETPTAGR